MKVDTALVAQGIADVERVLEDLGDQDGIGISTLRIVADAIGGAIKEEHPRFNAGAFTIDAMPIGHQRIKETILATLGRSEGPHD